MIKITCFVSILLLVYSINILPESRMFNWPLKINNGYSSSFQEFRPGHFHGGIDIRTFQKTGFPVQAVQDGYIYRIRHVKRGSGKGLYIRHKNGLSSIYFHLRDFNQKVEKIIKSLQRLKGEKYIGSYDLQKPIFVKRGQIIGYSGETGSGFPHLHLEIRDKENALINPFKLINFPLMDKNLPVLRNLLIRSVGETEINGNLGEFILPFHRGGSTVYEIPEIISVNGEFELVLNAFDISDSGKHVAPSGLELFLNGEKVFDLKFTRFEYDDNNQLGFVYDMFFSSSSTYFFNLFNQTGFIMSGDSRRSENIFKLLKSGENNLKINVFDNFDNVTTGSFLIYKIAGAEISLDPTALKSKNPFIKIKEFNPGSSSKIIYSLFGKNNSLQLKQEFTADQIMAGGILNVPAGMSNEFLFIDISFFKNDQMITRKCFTYNNNDIDTITDLDIDKFINRDMITIKLKNKKIASNNIVLEVIQGGDRNTILPGTDSDGLFFSFKPLNFKPDLKLNFSLYNNTRLSAQIQKKIKLVKLTDGREQSLKVEDLELKFGLRSVREDKALLVESVSYPSSFPVISSQFNIYPYTFPFLDRVLIKFHSNAADPEQIGIFRYSLKQNKWSYSGTSIKRDEGVFTTISLTPGIFALMRDVFNPEIYFKRPVRLTRKTLDRFKIIITDKGKGVDDDTIRVVLNGKPVLSEYDPDWKTLAIEKFETNIQTGWNSLEVTLKDHAGNLSSKTTNFKVE